MLIVIVGWVFFRANGLKNALSIIKLMFSFDFSETYIVMPSFINIKTFIVLIFAIVFSGPAQQIVNKLRNKEFFINLYSNFFEYFVIIIILLFSIVELTVSSYNPFIYFRF